MSGFRSPVGLSCFLCYWFPLRDSEKLKWVWTLRKVHRPSQSGTTAGDRKAKFTNSTALALGRAPWQLGLVVEAEKESQNSEGVRLIPFQWPPRRNQSESYKNCINILGGLMIP
nr:uncharacterized protein C21orf62 homolog isoform X2 [Rattus norvegicus]